MSHVCHVLFTVCCWCFDWNSFNRNHCLSSPFHLPTAQNNMLVRHAFVKTRFTAKSKLLFGSRKMKQKKDKKKNNAWLTINSILLTRSFVVTVFWSRSIWYCARICARFFFNSNRHTVLFCSFYFVSTSTHT